jgi:hypothetical protein
MMLDVLANKGVFWFLKKGLWSERKDLGFVVLIELLAEKVEYEI